MEFKACTVKELSGMYFPHSSLKSATTQLRRWIKVSATLQQQLAETGYTVRQKVLTPRQVRIIVEHLGEP